MLAIPPNTSALVLSCFTGNDVLPFDRLRDRMHDRGGGKIRDAAVRMALARLVADGKLRHHSRGRYCLPSAEDPKEESLPDWVAAQCRAERMAAFNGASLKKRYHQQFGVTLSAEKFGEVLAQLEALGVLYRTGGGLYMGAR
jgi:hypothetical protein